MLLSEPFKISSRLLPAVEVGGAVIQLAYSRRAGRDGRTRYEWTIDLPGGESYTGDDLQSGCHGGGLQEGFASLLSFLSACGESVAYSRRTGRPGENADLFPQPVAEWADENADNLSLLAYELEAEGPFIDE